MTIRQYKLWFEALNREYYSRKINLDEYIKKLRELDNKYKDSKK